MMTSVLKLLRILFGVPGRHAVDADDERLLTTLGFRDSADEARRELLHSTQKLKDAIANAQTLDKRSNQSASEA